MKGEKNFFPFFLFFFLCVRQNNGIKTKNRFCETYINIYISRFVPVFQIYDSHRKLFLPGWTRVGRRVTLNKFLSFFFTFCFTFLFPPPPFTRWFSTTYALFIKKFSSFFFLGEGEAENLLLF